ALVGPRDAVAEVVQDLGDPAHAGTADADEVDVADGVLHDARLMPPPSPRSRRRRAPPRAGGRARAPWLPWRRAPRASGRRAARRAGAPRARPAADGSRRRATPSTRRCRA